MRTSGGPDGRDQTGSVCLAGGLGGFKLCVPLRSHQPSEDLTGCRVRTQAGREQAKEGPKAAENTGPRGGKACPVQGAVSITGQLVTLAQKM